jgi:thioredoxin-dependent peroxiredoxin
MSKVTLDSPVPDFERPATGDKSVRLSDFKGKQHVVLYFYPKDDTSGCTTEGRDFTEQYGKLKTKGVAVLGVSRDSIRSHEKFKEKYGFPFDLLSDEDESLCRLFDVIRMKNMYGRQVMGIERSTFLIDRDGILRREWRKVKVPGHVDEVLGAISEL